MSSQRLYPYNIPVPISNYVHPNLKEINSKQISIFYFPKSLQRGTFLYSANKLNKNKLLNKLIFFMFLFTKMTDKLIPTKTIVFGQFFLFFEMGNTNRIHLYRAT